MTARFPCLSVLAAGTILVGLHMFRNRTNLLFRFWYVTLDVFLGTNLSVDRIHMKLQVNVNISGAGNSMVFPLDLHQLLFDHVNYNWMG